MQPIALDKAGDEPPLYAGSAHKKIYILFHWQNVRLIADHTSLVPDTTARYTCTARLQTNDPWYFRDATCQSMINFAKRRDLQFELSPRRTRSGEERVGMQ